MSQEVPGQNGLGPGTKGPETWDLETPRDLKMGKSPKNANTSRGVSDLKASLDYCKDPARSCKDLNFSFPAKTELFYWVRNQCTYLNFFESCLIFLSSSMSFDPTLHDHRPFYLLILIGLNFFS